jgi:hypothetical protein
MDFEYENGVGPVDLSSPFLKSSSYNQPSIFQQRKRKTFWPSKETAKLTRQGPASDVIAPSEFPNLRAPTGQTTFFSDIPRSNSPDKPLPRVPNTPLFRTPRAPKPIIDSSPIGGDSPSTPNQDADSEATPELFSRRKSPSKMVPHTPAADDRKTSPKKKRNSLLAMFTPTRRSPTKSTVAYSRKAESRIIRRRDRNKKRSETEDSETDGDKKLRSKNTGFIQGTLAPFFKVIEDHPNVPSMLINYLQALSNLVLFLFVAYLVWSMWSGIVKDVNKGVAQGVIDATHIINDCKAQFDQMNCNNPVRSAIEICNDLARCKEQDPTHVARGQVSARTFAMILNDFAEHISWKAMFFYLAAFVIFLVCNNLTWNGLRNKFTPDHQYQYMHPPPTPQRFPSNGMYPQTPYGVHGYYTPAYLHSQQHSQMEPGPTPGASQDHRRLLNEEYGS